MIFISIALQYCRFGFRNEACQYLHGSTNDNKTKKNKIRKTNTKRALNVTNVILSATLNKHTNTKHSEKIKWRSSVQIHI